MEILGPGPEDIKHLIDKEYKNRLRPKPAHSDMEDIQELKTDQKFKKKKSGLDNARIRKDAGLNRCIFHS